MAITKVSRGLLSTGIVDNSNATAITIDSSENVGIGTTSPTEKLSILGGHVSVGDSTGANGTEFLLEGYRELSGGSKYGNISIRSTYNTGSNASDMLFYTASGGTNTAERMRIDSSGDVQIGTTSQISSAKVTIQEASTSAGLFIRKGSGTTGTSNIYIGFDISGGGVTGGTITNSSAGNAQFTASSDERLKENIEDVTGCLDKIMALKPSSYTLKENKLDVPYGFIAQNVETVLPEFVSEDKNGYKQISDGLTSGYIAVLTKAIQELSAEVEELKTKLENK